MKLYTNTVPVWDYSKDNCPPTFNEDGGMDYEESNLVEAGCIFKLIFIDRMEVYLQYKNKAFVFPSEMFKLFFKETEVEV